MDLKEVYTSLEKIEGGADLITAIKAEVQKINGEAAKSRTEIKTHAETIKKLETALTTLGLSNGDMAQG